MTAPVTRRSALALLGGAGAAALAVPAGRSAEAVPTRRPLTHEVALVANERPYVLPAFPQKPLPFWLYGEAPFPTIRVTKGDRIRARLTNRLPEHTSIHWHGLRIANGMDGIPWLTQPPTRPGESFLYDFIPPDAGTFFFHPHCDEIGQVGRGLEGLLIVDDAEPGPYAVDHVLAVRDWRIDAEKGAFLPFTTDQGAARAGTFGTLRSVNGRHQPDFAVPTGGYARIRILSVDPTRIMEIGVEGAEAAIIAVDGFAVGPLPLESWRMSMAMRLDIAIRVREPGATARLVDYFGSAPTTLATFTAAGGTGTAGDFAPPPLAPHGLPEPDLANAETIPFTFSASSIAGAVPEPIVLPDGRVYDPADTLCLSGSTFWAINRQSWPGHGATGLPQPLATLKLGRTYVFELLNTTPHSHPVHIHGFGAKVLECSRLARPMHRADTVLLTTKERIRLAFVADNPGDWMFHCHILEHQETGMMGIIRVA
ncbi:multicopper oxidase family protein [Labrys wisconsinensis]|uniref:FtsP/CotA-like multicopper oxidase with cupredoxin domain n=1 Tax=Labrys wisconsinensis TaxID=425677 RepID=A0ABU0JAH4_9HYPH|nr:multicopper oxidase family protein [Labrys wisconsinensis]MDQ0471262.1 FtsP/CotA-like multicopper oxidase with cupredoxin domain [Labrys wisconsinensis]